MSHGLLQMAVDHCLLNKIPCVIFMWRLFMIKNEIQRIQGLLKRDIVYVSHDDWMFILNSQYYFQFISFIKNEIILAHYQNQKNS